jgi:CP family cyanate transporter-like MFS transporter
MIFVSPRHRSVILSGLPDGAVRRCRHPPVADDRAVGALDALLIGLVLCAAGSVAARHRGPNIAMLYFGTIVTAFGVAVITPALRRSFDWVPRAIGFAPAVYTNGSDRRNPAGRADHPAGACPLLHRAGNGTSCSGRCRSRSSPRSFCARRARAAVAPTAASRRWMPDFRNPMIWRIGLLLGSVNATYFSMNGFLPDYLTHTGRPELIHAALTWLNLGQLPASFLLLASAGPHGAHHVVLPRLRIFLPGRGAGDRVRRRHLGGDRLRRVGLLRRHRPHSGSGAAAADLAAGGCPPHLGRDVRHQLLLRGDRADHQRVLWDLTGWTLAPFIPIFVCMCALIGLAPTIVLREKSAGA